MDQPGLSGGEAVTDIALTRCGTGTSGITVVITTVQPRRRMLARALRSVWEQTLQPDVVVIAQDNERLGAPHCRQRGTDAVATDLVAYLDDDDELNPDHLEILYELLGQPPDAQGRYVDLVYPWFTVIGGEDPFPQHFGKQWDQYQIPVTFLAWTDSIRRGGGWLDGQAAGVDPEGNRAGEDWRLIQRMHALGMRFHHVPLRTWRWHHDSGNTSGRPEYVPW